jgi:hypothetical protein
MSKRIKVSSTDKSLSSYVGLLLAAESIAAFDVRAAVTASMPELVSGKSLSLNKFQAMMLGMMAGAECLDDFNTLAEDSAYAETVSGKVYSAKAYGDFLRQFNDYHCKTLQWALISQSFAMREKAIGKTRSCLKNT